MKQKLFTLLTLLVTACFLMVGATSAWAETYKVKYNGSDSGNTDYFTNSGNHNFNTKFTGCTYDGTSFTSGLKMEGSTSVSFTNTYTATVTIVQSTWSDHTIKFDGNALAVADAEAITGGRIYTINNVAAGTHSVTRGSGESGVFAVTVTESTSPGAISFSPTAGSVAAGASVTLTSSGATTIQYQWGASAIGEGGDWSGAVTYSGESKPVVPAAGSANTVLSVKATNANGTTYGSAAYTPVKMALKTIYSFADGIGSQEVSDGDALIDGTSQMSIKNTAGRIKLTAATGLQFENGDAITFSGSMGNSAKAYGIKYGRTTDLGTNLNVEAGAACYVSGTLTLASATDDLYIGRYDGTTTNFVSFAVRRLVAATSEAFAGVKIGGSAATEGEDYTIDGSTITLSETFTAAPTVALVNHIVFEDESIEDQNLLVVFGNPDGEFFTGAVTIDGTEYTVKAPCGQINALKVEYKDGETTVKEEHIDVTGLKVGASYTVPFRMYVEKDGALYQTTKNGSNPYYGDAVTLAFNTTVTKTVTPVDLGGGTLELLEDLDDTDGENAGIRASNRSAYNNKAYTSPGTLSPGMYTFIVKAQNKGRGSSVKVGDKTIFTISDINSSTGSWTDQTITDIVVPAEGHVTLVEGGSNTIDCYDIIIAIRTGISTTIANSGYSSLGSAYGLDFAKATTSTENAVNLTAFAATESSQTSVKLVSIDEAPAATGVILKGTPGATYTIPVKADAAALTVTNLLHAAVTATDIKGNTSYIMQGGQFHLVTADSTVPAGKAYLQAATGGAKALTVVFADELTGVANVNAAEAVQPVKRIVNGQLVIEKSGKRYNAAGAEF